MPLFAVLSVRRPWKTILRKFGQMLFGASPAKETAILEDVIKTWKNRAHFRNIFLTYAKTRTKQNPPPFDTAYGIQRLSILFGFSYFSAMLDLYKRVEKERMKNIVELKMYPYVDKIHEIAFAKGSDFFIGYGYDLAVHAMLKQCLKDLKWGELPVAKEAAKSVPMAQSIQKESTKNAQSETGTPPDTSLVLKEQIAPLSNRIELLEKQFHNLQEIVEKLVQFRVDFEHAALGKSSNASVQASASPKVAAMPSPALSSSSEDSSEEENAKKEAPNTADEEKDKKPKALPSALTFDKKSKGEQKALFSSSSSSSVASLSTDSDGTYVDDEAGKNSEEEQDEKDQGKLVPTASEDNSESSNSSAASKDGNDSEDSLPDPDILLKM